MCMVGLWKQECQAMDEAESNCDSVLGGLSLIRAILELRLELYMEDLWKQEFVRQWMKLRVTVI